MKLKNGSRQVQVKRHFRLQDDNLTRVETAQFEFEYSDIPGLTKDEIIVQIDKDLNEVESHAGQLEKRLEASIAAWYLKETGKELPGMEGFETGEERQNGKTPVQEKPREQPRTQQPAADPMDQVPPAEQERPAGNGHRPPTGPMIAKVMRTMEEDNGVKAYVEKVCALAGADRIKDLSFDDVSKMLDHIKTLVSRG